MLFVTYATFNIGYRIRKILVFLPIDLTYVNSRAVFTLFP